MTQVVSLLLLLLCTLSVGQRDSRRESSQKRQTLYILTMVPFPDEEKPAWARPNFGAAHSLLPAAQLAVDQINNRSDILKDYTLELLVGDSGCNVVTTTYVSQVEHIMHSGKLVVGIVGPACSEAALSVAALNRQMRLGMVHVTTGSIPLLDNRTEYPNTFGIISSSTTHVDAILELMKENNWSRVAVLYDLLRPYYIETYKAFLEEDYIKTQANITFAGGITQTFLPLEEISDKGTRVIVVMSSTIPAHSLVCLAAHYKMIYPAYQYVFQDRKLAHFIGSEVTVTQLSTTYTCSREMMTEAINGSILLHFGLTSVASETVTVSQLTVDQIHKEYDKRLKQHAEEMNMSLDPTVFAYAFYDAVWAMALSVNMSTPLLNGSTCPPSETIREQFYNLNFQGATVTVKFNNQTGRVSSIVDVHQANYSDTNLIGKWNGTHLIKITNTTGDFVKDSFESTTVLLDPVLAAVGVFVSTLVFLLTAVIQIINIAYRNHKSIKASSPRLNHMIFFGCYAVTAAILIYTIQVAYLPNLTSNETVGSIFCNAFAWCLNIGYTLILATILVKLWRLNYIFFKAVKKQFLTDKLLILAVFILLILEILLCIVWASVAHLIQLKIESLHKEGSKQVVIVELQCESSDGYFIGIIIGYKFLLTTLVLYFSIRNRHIKMKQFHNTKSVNALLYTLTLLWGLGGPVWLVLYIQHIDLNITYSAFCLLLTLTSLLSLFFIFSRPIINLIEERHPRRKLPEPTWQKIAMFGLEPI